MGGLALQTIREAVLDRGVVPVELNVEFRVVYSTLQGSMPVNDRIHGSILDIPINLRLEYTTMPNTYGTFPVNNFFSGTIGDCFVEGKMRYKMVYSTIAGNFPVNTAVDISIDGRQYQLSMPTTFALGRTRGAGSGSTGGGGALKKKVGDPKYKGGVLVDDDGGGGGGGGPQFEVQRPICAGIQGALGDIALDLNYSYVYYTNTSSGRNPINNKLSGELHRAA